MIPLAPVGRPAVKHIQKSFFGQGLGALYERPRSGENPKLDVKAEDRLIVEVCVCVPECRARLTIYLLDGQLVELGVVRTILDEPSAGRSKNKLKQQAMEPSHLTPQFNSRLPAVITIRRRMTPP